MKKILLTGASGFIGRHCIPLLLDREYEVHAISLTRSFEFSKDVIWHKQSLLDIEATRRLMESIRPSDCLHLAWCTEHGRYWTAAENLHWVSASMVLLQSFHRNGGLRFVGAGTCAEYDWRYGHCSEDLTPLVPSTLYGVSKDAFQKILKSYSDTFSLSSAWGRVFFAYGPYEHHARLVPSVITSLLRGQVALCSLGNQIRDFIHVLDVAGAFVSLLQSEVKAGVNIASGTPVSVRHIAETIARQIDRMDLLKLGALPARNESHLVTADISRLKHEVGYEPHLSLESGLSQTIDWWQASMEKNK